jgi:hypothetical protein
MAKVVYVSNPAAFAAEFKTAGGMVGRDLKARGEALVALARHDVGKKTGRLAASIGSNLGHTAGGELMVTVGSSNRIALIHHNGTRPHLIFPKRARALRFTSGGRIVYTRIVRHPGTRPNPYLTSNLSKVV